MKWQITDYLSVIALVISFLSLAYTYLATRRTAHREEVMAHYTRSMDYHGTLADDMSTFRLYGVDIDSAKNEGVTDGQIRYLLRYLIAIGAKIDYDKKSMSEHLETCSYCRNILGQQETRTTYRYVRLAISDFIREGVDHYLKQHYKMEFQGEWVDPLPPGGDSRSSRLIHFKWM
jgi:hypothetical protein